MNREAAVDELCEAIRNGASNSDVIQFLDDRKTELYSGQAALSQQERCEHYGEECNNCHCQKPEPQR